jgi:hypothetical protein
MPFRTLRQEAFTTPLTPPGERCTSSFGLHPGAETVLAFPGSLGWLEGAFHI